MLGSSARLINPGELETYLEQEKKARKRARLVQVRSQSKEISHNIRQAVEKARDHQLHLEGVKRKKQILNATERQLGHLQSQYSTCFDHIGEAHQSVQIQEQLQDLLDQKSNINTKIANNRGKAALFQMRQFQGQKGEEEIKRIEKRKEIMQNERIRAAKVATLPKRPVDVVKAHEYKTHKSPMKKGVEKMPLTPKPRKRDEENKENSPRVNSTSLKSEKSRRKRRVSVGYKNKQSNGAKSKAKTTHESEQLPSPVVSRNETSSQDARKLANDLNTIMTDRYKDAMSKVQAEKNKNEVMQTLEKLEKFEKLKESKRTGEENQWTSTYAREEQQLQMEKLVEDMMRVEIVDKPASNHRADPAEVASDLSLWNSVKKPEIIKIASPTVRVHKTPAKLTVSARDSPETVPSPSDSSPETFKCSLAPLPTPSYMHNSPKLRQNDPSWATTMQLDLVVPAGRIQWQPRDRTLVTPAGRIQWQPRDLTLPTRIEDPRPTIDLAAPPTPRRSSVHKAVVTRELLKNFFEVRGVQSPARKAFTKSYVQSSDTPKVTTRGRGFFPPVSDDVRDTDDAKSGDNPRATWANELVSEQLETSVTSNQSDDSLRKEMRKVKAQEAKIVECSRDVERIAEQKSQLQEELENVRRARQELEEKHKKTEEELKKMCQMAEDEEMEPEDDFQDDFQDDWTEREVNVTVRRPCCPVTRNRGMIDVPHELSAITEYDTPNTSWHPARVTLSPLPWRTSRGGSVGPGILEEPQMTLLESEDPSLVFSQFKCDQLSPLSEMLHACKQKYSVSPKGPDAPSPSSASLSDSLMSFQRHELSAYGDVDANFTPFSSPIFRGLQSFDFNSDSEVKQILEKWEKPT